MRVNNIIPVGTVGNLVTGSSGTLGLGRGSDMIGRSSSLGIVGAKITRDKTITQKVEAFLKHTVTADKTLSHPFIPENKQ
jgi:hypothetical protein